mmetsp:Transcript_62246/g.167041  ORF Transcript_62246/g.167041 Transcript_62246/m.167041 type:complete len:240 (+) Transcript_62246:162-881(+)
MCSSSCSRARARAEVTARRTSSSSRTMAAESARLMKFAWYISSSTSSRVAPMRSLARSDSASILACVAFCALRNGPLNTCFGHTTTATRSSPRSSRTRREKTKSESVEKSEYAPDTATPTWGLVGSLASMRPCRSHGFWMSASQCAGVGTPLTVSVWESLEEVPMRVPSGEITAMLSPREATSSSSRSTVVIRLAISCARKRLRNCRSVSELATPSTLPEGLVTICTAVQPTASPEARV